MFVSGAEWNMSLQIAECHHLDAHADTGVQFEMSEELRYMTIGAVISGQHSAAAQLTESEDSEDESDEEDDDADDGFRVVRKRPRMGTGHVPKAGETEHGGTDPVVINFDW